MASSLGRTLLTRQLQRRLPWASTSISSSLPSLDQSIAVARSNFSQRYFTSGDDSDKSKEEKSTTDIGETDLSMASSPVAPMEEDAVYSVEDIMSTFQDTSYFDPIERPDFSHMTNEELNDTSTIPGWELIHSPPKDKETIPRGALVGTVVSTKMSKTVNVAVDRYRVHRKYRKRLRYTKKFMAHDDAEVANTGDLVMIVPCQRISKHKHFMLREIIRAKGQL